MHVDYGKIFGGALRYAFSADKLLPMFTVYAVMVLSLVFVGSAALDASGTTEAFAVSLIGGIALFAVVFMALILVSIFLAIAYTHNAFHHAKGGHEKLSASYDYAKTKYLKTLGATVMTYVVAFAAGIMLFPLSIIGIFDDSIGLLIARIIIENAVNIAISLALLLYLPIIVLESKGLIDSLKESFGTFRKNAKAMLIYWLIWLVMFMILLIPAALIMIFGVNAIMPGAAGMQSLAAAVKAAMPLLALLAIALAAIVAYMQVFYMASVSYLYAQLRHTRR
ncbi:MAG TPA: hypothetical protein VI979_01525 [archaeon]|nr:hypothetical protein [Candidatus Aenigmarchaeota archaeon]HLD83516.1 hypothetical protein [archaeon]